ncbi:uncharacterized protein [Argopecten irradians]|uniref:uncharacterized protein n=1 Tax=Argopecten irradians TaxID=31199 RepID=UPI00371EFC1F
MASKRIPRKRKAPAAAVSVEEIPTSNLAAVTQQITKDVTAAVLQELRLKTAPADSDSTASSIPVIPSSTAAAGFEAQETEPLQTNRDSVMIRETGALNLIHTHSDAINLSRSETYPPVKPPQLSCRPLYQKVSPKLRQKI